MLAELPAATAGLSRLTGAGGELSVVANTKRDIAAMEETLRKASEAAAGPGGLAAALRAIGTTDLDPTVVGLRRITEGAIAADAATRRLEATLSRLGGTMPPPAPAPAAPATTATPPIMTWTGDSWEYRAQGGSVGPRGTDTIPAWLSPGEFVMPARQTQQYFTQLVSMLHGTAPRYYAGGGPVSVGDIHVHVTGQAQPEATIRNIAYGLKRELRRNTINF